MNTINQIFFSPTETTKKIVNKIGNGIGFSQQFETDITLYKNNYNFKESDLVIIGAPVYAGRIPEVVIERISDLKGSNSLAVVVVVYGNREFDDALLELRDLATDKGFNVISAAAFIGEHSFSDSIYPIAADRPNEKDLELAFEYGEKIKSLINSGDIKNNISVDGNRPYKERKQAAAFSPITYKDRCSLCMKCVDLCPTNAIDKNNPLITEAQLCIKCAACVKTCPSNARVFENEYIQNVAKRLNSLCNIPKNPSIFI